MALTIVVLAASNLTLKRQVGLFGPFASRLMLFLGMKSQAQTVGAICQVLGI
jgi:hypothetical protein